MLVESAITIAFQASLSPPPCIPLPEAHSSSLPIGSTGFYPRLSDQDWELTGPESCIRLCEVKIAYTNELGWGMHSN